MASKTSAERFFLELEELKQQAMARVEPGATQEYRKTALELVIAIHKWEDRLAGKPPSEDELAAFLVGALSAKWRVLMLNNYGTTKSHGSPQEHAEKRQQIIDTINEYLATHGPKPRLSEAFKHVGTKLGKKGHSIPTVKKIWYAKDI